MTTPAEIKMMAYELSGVIEDVQHDSVNCTGFDSVCLDTVKRIHAQLFELAEQVRMLRASEREGWRYSSELETERVRLNAEIMRLNPTYIGP